MIIILPLFGAILLVYSVGLWTILYHLMKFRIPDTPAILPHNPRDKSILIATTALAVSGILFITLGTLLFTTPWPLVGIALSRALDVSLPCIGC